MRLELLQLVEVRIEVVARPLREEVATLKRLLAHDGVALEPTDAHALVLLDSAEQKLSGVEDEHLYSCFSPRGSFSPCVGASSTVMAPTDVDAAILFGGVLTPPPVEEVRSGSHEMWLLHRVRHLPLRSVVMLTLQSLPRLSPAERWLFLMVWLLSRGYCQWCPELSLPERFPSFSSPWPLPSRDPRLVDECLPLPWPVFFDAVLECRVEFVGVALWSMWVCCLCRLGLVVVGFRPVFS